jgi:D-sedoheptulose 7-phosphate isomerase
LSTLRERTQAILSIGSKWEDIQRVGRELKRSLDEGHSIYIIGNGGSLSQAEHFAAELFNKKVFSLSSPATLTAISNDYVFTEVFYKQLEKLEDDDTVIALTTSGHSLNVTEVPWQFQDKLINFIVISGNPLTDWDYERCEVIKIGDFNTQVIQEMTLIILHEWAEICGAFKK